MTTTASTNMNRIELEWRLLYCVLVAGKSSQFAETIMGRLFGRFDRIKEPPFNILGKWKSAGTLANNLRANKTGNYKRLVRCFSELCDSGIDTATCTPEDLQKIHGIGHKTARFFIIWTRPGARYAALDVHVLRWLRENGVDAPKVTPSNSKKYAELEKIFLDLCDKLGVSARDLDSAIWSKATGVY